MCGVARQGAAGKALSAQGFVVVVGRPRETFTENGCRTGIRGNRILDGTGENLLLLLECRFVIGCFWKLLRRLWRRKDEEKRKFEGARSQWICESECWDSEMRWIWRVWIELKNRYGK